MQLEISKFRNLCHVYGVKIAATLCLFIFALQLIAQPNRHNYNYLDFQKKPYYFGITMGLNTSNYRINHSKNFVNNDSILVAESPIGVGFNLKVIGNLKIGEYFDFRVLPGFVLGERSLEFINPADSEGPRLSRSKIESVFFDMPFLVRYKSEPYKDKRVFVVAGLKYSYDVASNSKTREANSLIKISPHDFQFEIGGGIQFFNEFFIFSPEIKFSRGLGNILIFNDQINQAAVLEKLTSQVFTLSFHIEG